MRRGKYRVCVAMTLCLSGLVFAGCQKTPEKKAVVTKVDNLAEYAKADPLGEGEKQSIELPETWTVDVTRKGQEKSDGAVEIRADISLSPIERGNLPIIEVANRPFGEEELQRLVSYFSGGRTLYKKGVSASAYERLLARLDEIKDGYPAGDYDRIRQGLERVIAKAREEEKPEEEAPVRFEEKDPSAYNLYAVFTGTEFTPSEETYAYFSCDIDGEERESIRAIPYDDKKGKTSSFYYEKGYSITLDELQHEKEYLEQGVSLQEQACMAVAQDRIAQLSQTQDQEADRQAAEGILAITGREDFILGSEEPVYYFTEDPGWSFLELNGVDWEQAKTGRSYTFYRSVGGFAARTEKDNRAEMAEESYTPPFGVEKVTVDVCEGEVCGFAWVNMAEDVQVLAENTKLLDFQTIADTVVQKFQYYVANLGAAHDLTDTTYRYEIEDVALGYTYVPAYGQPEHAWLIPAWFFQVTDGFTIPGREVTHLPGYTTVNALDGSIIHVDAQTLNDQVR